MTAIARHALIRLGAVVGQPLQLGLLVFCGLCSVLFWPGLTDASGSGWMDPRSLEFRGALFSSIVMMMYVVGLPMVAIGAVRGSAAQSGRHTAWAVQSHPALPIGFRARALAEALAALAPILLVRALAFASGLVPTRFWLGLEGATSPGGWLLESTIAGGLVMLGMLLVTGSTSSSIESHWLRAVLAAAALIWVMKLGWFESLWTSVPTTLGLVALALAVAVGRHSNRGSLWRRVPELGLFATGASWRPALSPEARFRRDLWLRPLPAAAALVALEAVVVALDRWIGLPRLGFLLSSVLVVSLLVAFVTLQPMRSRLAVAGTLGKPGFRPGDFAAAWSVLPVRRHVVGRGVFVFGLVTATATWLFAVGLVVLVHWLRHGEAALMDSDGDSVARLPLLMIALIPALAGFVTSAAHGNRRGSALSGAILLAFPTVGFLFLLEGPSNVALAVIILALGLVSAWPSAKHLRRER